MREQLRYGVPFASREVRVRAVVHSAGSIFQTRCLRVKFVKAGEGHIEICLVEELRAVDHAAVECQKMDSAPLGVHAIL
ncbi:hypothetical protein A5658_17180 [Mycobacterium sp. 1245111.1]|nr:hypothetical protein A5658_17180 [Mycobacterium sp. 1245111.1]